MSENFQAYNMNEEYKMSNELGYKLIHNSFGIGELPSGWYWNKGNEYNFLGDDTNAKRIIHMMYEEK